MRVAYSAVILAGGRGSRVGGVAKPLIEVGGRSMLQAALAAADGAEEIVVVGDVPVPPGVRQIVEDPPRSGPAAALTAGVSVLIQEVPWILVLAADLPGVDAAVPGLLDAAAADTTSDGLCFHDASGHPQWMLALYRSGPLRRVIAEHETTDLPLKRLVAPLTLSTISGDAAAISDCDTWEEIEAARAAHAEGES